MLDQPVHSDNPPPVPDDHPASQPVQGTAARTISMTDVPATEAGPSPTPTIVIIPPSGRIVPRWATFAAGIGGCILLLAAGWLTLGADGESTAPEPSTASADTPPPPAAVERAPSPAEAPDTGGWSPSLPQIAAPSPPSAPGPDIPVAADAAPPWTDDGDTPEPMDRYEASVRIEKGDTLESVLRDMEFASGDIRMAAAALKLVMKSIRLPVGEILTLQVQTPAAPDGKPILQSLIIRPEARREITLERNGDGSYIARQRTFDVRPKLVRTSGVVKGSLRGSADAAGIPPPVLAEMLRAFSWDVNFQYDVKAGDRFAILIEQTYTTDGRLVSSGRVLWAQLTTGGGRSTHTIYRFKPERGAEFFYYANGQSVVKSLLRTPMNLSRISSRFGFRSHPVLGFNRMHTGVDFAAPYGTPILAAGAGRIVQAGRYGGYGNWVKIDHGGGIATGYGHMARYAPGVRPGVHVRQGQVVGFVGSTGMSTGPHLHYELHQQGRPVNPLTARASQRASLSGKDMARFRTAVSQYDRARTSAELIAAR
jgi:murein DD-endopeptidase MepM/ murein hydrolase activator NlpD